METTGAGALEGGRGFAGTTHVPSSASTAPVLGLDTGYKCPGIAAVQLTRPRLLVTEVGAIVTRPAAAKHVRGIREADQHVERNQQGFRFLLDAHARIKPALIIVQTPGTGGRSADAVRGMAYGLAQAVCLVEVTGTPAMWVSQEQVKRAVAPRAGKGKDPIHKATREAVDFAEGADPATLPVADLRAAAMDAVGVVLASKDTAMVKMLMERGP